MKSTTRLRQMIHQDTLAIAPGVYDGLSAKLVEQAGFQCVYASGGAIARATGVPDIGLLSVTEIAQHMAAICDATSLPVIADADNGYGNALNTYRSVQTFARLGAAGLHLEDQQFPKRCGHLDDKKLISLEEMCGKIKAARDACEDSDLVLIARTDAIAAEGFNAAIERASAYAEAGADMLFVEAPESESQIQDIAQRLSQPKLINMFAGGKTPMVPVTTLQQWGYRIVIIPSDLQRASIFAIQAVLEVIKRNGDSSSFGKKMVSFKERETIIGTEHYLNKYPV